MSSPTSTNATPVVNPTSSTPGVGPEMSQSTASNEPIPTITVTLSPFSVTTKTLTDDPRTGPTGTYLLPVATRTGDDGKVTVDVVNAFPSYTVIAQSSNDATVPSTVQTSATTSTESSASPPDVKSSSSSSPPIQPSSNSSSSAVVPTQSSSNSTTSSANPTPQSKGGIPSTTVAGAVVGTAVGAALLGFLVAFLLYRRKRRNDLRGGGVYLDEKTEPPQHPWEAFLPQSADDSTVQRAVESLYSQIDLHVENYYGNSATGVISTESQASLLKVGAEFLPQSAEDMLSDCNTLVPIIKHCFAWTIISRLPPGADGGQSLLPAQFARYPPKQGVMKSGGEREDRAMDQAYNYWRVLTAQLLYPSFRKNNAVVPDAPGRSEVCETLSKAFAPWAKATQGNASAREHLQSVLKTATTTGLLVASQPSTFAYEWDILHHTKSTADRDTVVTFPAFEKTADEHGNVLQQRQVLVKPKTETVM